MTAPCCKQRIEVHTDPKNAEYVIVSGARRKVEAYNPEDAGTVELDPAARSAKLADPLAKLEHEGEDVQRAVERRVDLETLKEDSAVRHRDDYDLNKRLRSQMRSARKDEKSREDRRKDLGLPSHIKLLPGSQSDALRASAVQFGGKDKFTQNWKLARRKIASSSIFTPKAVVAAAGKRPRPSSSAAPPVAVQPKSKKTRFNAAVKLKLSQPGNKT